MLFQYFYNKIKFLKKEYFFLVPDTGTLETAAQVLEVNNDDGLHTMLAMVRKAIARKYKEVVKGHHLERRKSKR